MAVGVLSDAPLEYYAGRAVAARDLGDRTRRNYETVLRTRLAGTALGKATVGEITQDVLTTWWRETAKRPGSTLAWRVVASVLREAQKAGATPGGLLVPSTAPPAWEPQEAPALTAEMIMAIIRAHPESLRPLPLLAAGAGLRYSEAAVVRGVDVDVNDCTISVVQTVASYTPMVIKDLDSPRARVAPITKAVARTLAKRIAELDDAGDLLVSTRSGRPVAQNNYGLAWRASLQEAGAPEELSFDALRMWRLKSWSRAVELAELAELAGTGTRVLRHYYD